MFGFGRGKGYEPRDYRAVPEFSAYPEFSGVRVPRSEWKARVEHLNATKSQPYHWHRRYCKIQNQKSTPYCWMYGTVACMLNRYAMQGVGYVDLSPFAIAYRGKNGAMRGGYGVEACRYIQEWGVPTKEYFPEHKKDMSLWNSPEVKNSASKHKLVEFQELGRNDFEGVVSALIGPDPCPVTLALSWWGHLVAGLGVAFRGDEVGLIFANSWGDRYKEGGLDGGYGILWGHKAVPFEAVAVRHVRAREEV